MLDIFAAIALAAALLTGGAQNGDTTSADGDRPIIVQGGGNSAAEGDRPIIVQGGGSSAAEGDRPIIIQGGL